MHAQNTKILLYLNTRERRNMKPIKLVWEVLYSVFLFWNELELGAGIVHGIDPISIIILDYISFEPTPIKLRVQFANQ